MILKLIIFTILFCIFIEIYVGSISIRVNSDNQYSFNILSMLNFLVHPLHNSFLWNPQVWLVNYPLMISLFIILNLILNQFFKLPQNELFERLTSNTTTGNFKTDI